MLVENFIKLFLDMNQLISVDNRMLIRQHLNDGCISYNQLFSDLIKIFRQLYETPIEHRTFHILLNTHISFYLQSAKFQYERFNSFSNQLTNYTNMRKSFKITENILPREISVMIKNTTSVLPKERMPNVTSVDVFIQSFSHDSNKIASDHQRILESFPVSFEIPFRTENFGVSLLPKTIVNEELPALCDFQSFVLPLKQDYTKSGKGYIEQNKMPYEKLKFENTCNDLSDCDFLNTEEVDSDELWASESDDENYDPAYDSIISRYFDSLQNSFSESEISSHKIYDSDSDDSVVFLQEGAGLEKYKINNQDKKLCFRFSSNYDSDSNDEVHEQFNNKYTKTASKLNINICDTKYELSDSENSYSDDLFENYEGTDSNSLLQNFDFNFTMNELSGESYSLSQNEMQVCPKNFEGFINPCFEDDILCHNVSLRCINSKWESVMQDVSNEPRQPKKVSFVPLPDLVSVQTFEPDDDGYRYSLYVLDQIRFKNRIQEFEEMIKPFLSPEHRANIYQYYSSNN